jgi:hypothetical protein
MSGTFLTGDGGSSPSQERLLARSVVNSPWRVDPVTQPDTSQAVSCAECGAKYLNQSFLAAHIETHNAPQDASPRRRRAKATEQ